MHTYNNLTAIPTTVSQNPHTPDKIGGLPTDQIDHCSGDIRELAGRINWLHGTNSSILTLLPHTDYTLIPTGRLLERGIAPMCGEISCGGMKTNGVNQSRISVDTIEGVERCWSYATKISHSFNEKNYYVDEYDDKFECYDDYFSGTIYELEKLTPNDHVWDQILVDLYRLKQWDPDTFVKLCNKYREKIDTLNERLTTLHSEQEMLVLKALNYDTKKLRQAIDNESTYRELENDFPFMNYDRRTGYSIKIWGSKDINTSGIMQIEMFRPYKDGYWSYDFATKHYMNICYAILHLKLYGQEKLIDSIMRNSTLEDKQNQLKKYDPSGTPQIQKVLENYITPIIQGRMNKNALPYKRRMERFEKLFNEAPKVRFDNEDLNHLRAPFPILFGSTKQKSREFGRGSEYHISRSRLGKDIDVAFVKEEHVEKIEQWLIKNQLSGSIRVHNFSELDAIKSELHHRPEQVERRKSFINSKLFKQLNDAIENHVLPIYQTPYGNIEGRERYWHGVMHASRTVIFAHIIGSMYKDAGHDITSTPMGMLIAAGMHDSARENDGPDLWDKDSGEMCKSLLEEQGDIHSELLGRAVAEKDSKTPDSLEQKIIHDADCMEIVRCLRHPGHFRRNELWVAKELDTEIVTQFISEAKLFIHLTQDKIIKDFVEKSPHPLMCLYQILLHVDQHYDQLSSLCKTISGDVYLGEGPQDYMLNPEIEENIKTLIENPGILVK